MTTTRVETGLFANGIPYIRGDHGPEQAVIYFGGSALFKRLDRSDGRGYARLFSRLLPEGYRFTILGYAEPPPGRAASPRLRDPDAHTLRDPHGPQCMRL